jgi:hypothetical protein
MNDQSPFLTYINDSKSKLLDRSSKLIALYHPRTWREKGLWWTIGLIFGTYLFIVFMLGIYWSSTPDMFDVREHALSLTNGKSEQLVPGYITTATTIRIAETLLDKHGGYLSNDIAPPGLYLDNIPNWEFGVLTEIRDIVRILRNDFSRSQTQSVEDKNLQEADPQFHFDSKSWILPSSESFYRKGIKELSAYLERLADQRDYNGQFFARADNLNAYLVIVEKRLGSLAQRLAAGAGQNRINIDLAGERNARQSTPAPSEKRVQTPWLELDDIFFEARGYSWALCHILKAIEIDFAAVLEDKNARVSLLQIIRELENTQAPIWSPMILNGTGFGPMANHSLIMASYISRANAAIIDLRDLLQQG